VLPLRRSALRARRATFECAEARPAMNFNACIVVYGLAVQLMPACV
jgi:hypothetical protein